MAVNNKLIAIFEDQPVRRVWNEKEEKWYFSVVDIIKILTSSVNPRKYWNKLSQRLRAEGSEVVTKCHHLKMILRIDIKDYPLKKPGSAYHTNILKLVID